jgi:hypothetical protein
MSAAVPQGIPTQDSGLRQYGFVIKRCRSLSSCDAIRMSVSALQLSTYAMNIPTPKSLSLTNISDAVEAQVERIRCSQVLGLNMSILLHIFWLLGWGAKTLSCTKTSPRERISYWRWPQYVALIEADLLKLLCRIKCALLFIVSFSRDYFRRPWKSTTSVSPALTACVVIG